MEKEQHSKQMKTLKTFLDITDDKNLTPAFLRKAMQDTLKFSILPDNNLGWVEVVKKKASK